AVSINDGDSVSSETLVNNIKTDPILDNVSKTETTRARIYLVAGIALAVLSVILSLAMIASVVFLCLTLGGVMVLPTAVTVILMVTAPLISLIGSISTGVSCVECWPVMTDCAICAIFVIIGAVFPAICGIWPLYFACGRFKNLPKVIEKQQDVHIDRQIQELLNKMKSDLLWQDSDAYAIAYLTLAKGLDPEMIQNLRRNQINDGGKTITLETKDGKKMQIDCDLQIPLESAKMFLGMKNKKNLVFDKEFFEKSYYAFIGWMQRYHSDTPIAINHIREGRGEFYWTRETVSFSLINIPQNTNLSTQRDTRPYYTLHCTLRYQDPSAFIIFFLVFHCGLRVEEIESLQCDMIDLGQGRGQITVPGKPKRIVLIRGCLAYMLGEMWRLGKGTSLAFPGSVLKKSLSTLAKFLEVSGFSKKYDREMSCEVLEDGPNSSTPTKKKFKPDCSFLKSNLQQNQKQ
ncbi:MAG: hypothetical protein LBT98_03815, partial [Puniceicoccales bacterium]|nr:hypothetical protein [Puniceicoccales bacterium]